MRVFSFLIALIFVLTTASPGYAQPTTPGQSPIISTDTVHSQLTSSLKTITPGAEFDLAWDIKLDPHWHVYWSNPGDSGIAPTLKVPGFTAAKPVFPIPHIISVPPITNYGYEDHVILTSHITAPANLPAGALDLPVKLTYLYCSDVCMPGQVSLSVPLTVAAQTIANPAFAQLQQAQARTLPHAMPADASLKAILNQDKTIAFSLNAAAFGGSLKDVRIIPSADGWLHDSAPQPLVGNTVTLALDPYQTKSVSGVEGLLLVNGTGYVLSTPLLNANGAPTSASAQNNTPPSGGSELAIQNNIGSTQAVPPAAPLLSAVMPPVTPPAPATAAALTLPLALFFALLAGLILNVMPCVLPVLSFKLLSLVRQRSATSRRRHALFYTFGVLAGFWAFAGVILLVQQEGQNLGWGFHLQNPLFVAVLVSLMLTIALNLFGVFEAGGSLTRFAGTPGNISTSPVREFLNDIAVGLLAVVVATPCTVPFMGGAVAYALGQPPLLALLVFTALGLGMALPFLLIGLVPALIAWLPKPGSWMLTLKHFFGWPMLATALWLLWVFANQTSFTATFMLLILLLGLAFTLWLYGRFPKSFTLALTIIPLALAIWLLPPLITMTTPGSPANTRADAMWQPWSAEAQATALKNNQAVFVDFTADWCLTCKVTEATVLDTARVQNFFRKNNIVLLQGDWTRQDAAITAELAAHGRRGVPLYLAYLPGHAQPVTFPQLLTPGLLEKTFSGR